MNVTAQGVGADETQQPQDQKDYKDGPKHASYLQNSWHSQHVNRRFDASVGRKVVRQVEGWSLISLRKRKRFGSALMRNRNQPFNQPLEICPQRNRERILVVDFLTAPSGLRVARRGPRWLSSTPQLRIEPRRIGPLLDINFSDAVNQDGTT